MESPLVLVTGFGAFTGVDENPSGAVARALGEPESEPLGGARVHGGELPVSFAGAPIAIQELLAASERPPAALLGLGVHRENWWRLESRAKSGLASEKPDNDGVLGRDVVVPSAVVGERRSSFDLDVLVASLTADGAGDVRTSDDAGGFVCEWVYRHLLMHGERLGVPALFLHVPPLRDVAVERQTEVVAGLVRAMVGQLAARA